MLLNDRVLELLTKWKESLAQGASPDLADLAGGDADLAAELKRHVAVLEKRNWGSDVAFPAEIGGVSASHSLASVLLLPEKMKLETLRTNLSRAELITSHDLKGLPRVKNAYQFAAWLLENKRLTQFQLRAIASGRTRGLKFGNYVILDKIGAGGMGEVYRARHSKMGREVALKVLSSDVVSRPNAIERFEREIRAVAKLQHPNIVAAFDADEAEGRHFFVMEYVDGPDLSSVIRRGGPVTVDKAIDYLNQAARGLEYAHSKGLIHRDIKPANLLLTSKGNVKILDMGIARLDAEANQAGLTKSGAVMGTIDYMAPEQAIDARSVTPQADIYSLGCTLYYLLTGHPPFKGDTLLVKLLQHRDESPPRLTAVRGEVPPALDAIFQKCLAKLPADRYADASQLIADLANVYSSVPAASAPILGSELAADHNRSLELSPPRVTVPASRSLMRGKNGVAFYGGAIGVGLVMCGLLYSAVAVLFPAESQMGTVVVTVDEEDFVAHLRDQELRLVNQETQETTPITLHGIRERVSLPAGQYAILADADDLRSDVDQLKVSSGSESTVQVHWEKPQPTVVAASPSMVAEPNEDPDPPGPPRDYDAFATGTWFKWPQDQADFDQVVADSANFLTTSSSAKLEDGVIALQGTNLARIADISAKNFILRGRLKYIQGQHISLRFYRPDGRVVAWFSEGGAFLGVGGVPKGGNWRVYTTARLPETPPPFAEYAIACIDTTLILYLNGKKVMTTEPGSEVAGDRVKLGIGAMNTASGEFKDIQYMVLADDLTPPK